MITEPNFIIFEFASICLLRLPNRIVFEVVSLGNHCEQWITESLGLPYRTVSGFIFGYFGGGVAKLKLLWNEFGNLFVCAIAAKTITKNSLKKRMFWRN